MVPAVRGDDGRPSFGAFGEGYLRFSYANGTGNIRRALERMGELLDGSGCPG